MKIKKIIIIIASLALLTDVYALLGPITIFSKTKIDENTHVAKVYTQKELKKSNSKNLYDFLRQHTSITTMPNYGNSYSQKISMRGFGIENGYQNIAIIVDEQKINNIDMTSQFLSNINIIDIERIEIIKGSGSVVYGDSAMAGVIRIYTKEHNSNTINVVIDDKGQRKLSFSNNFKNDKFSLSFSGSNQLHPGFSDSDSNGNSDKSKQKNGEFKINTIINPTTKMKISKSRASANVYFPDDLTLAQFNENPAQAKNGVIFTEQKYDVDDFNFAISKKMNNNLSIDFNHAKQEKSYKTIASWGNSDADYNYDSNDLIFNYKNHKISLITGIELFSGERDAYGYTTKKNNKSIFTEIGYKFADSSISIGGRKEKVNYEYIQNSVTKGKHKLEAYDIGFNKKIHNNVSIFTNYNIAYQAPDVDRFFTGSGNFNGFIEPAKIKTLNIGANYYDSNFSTKFSIFKSKLKNEIYYFDDAGFSNDVNTNIDKSYKYGFDLEHKHKLNKINLNLNYVYTIAKISKETQNDINFDGNYLPGVGKHNTTIALSYKPNSKILSSISHKYIAKSFNATDFDNNDKQKQKAYKSTDVTLFYQYSKKMTFSLSINNLFEKNNGLWIRDDAIYPINFSRNISLGINYDF